MPFGVCGFELNGAQAAGKRQLEAALALVDERQIGIHLGHIRFDLEDPVENDGSDFKFLLPDERDAELALNFDQRLFVAVQETRIDDAGETILGADPVFARVEQLSQPPERLGVRRLEIDRAQVQVDRRIRATERLRQVGQLEIGRSVIGIDGNRGGHIFELRADQREPGLVLPDRSFPLSFKCGVDDGELPTR